MQSAPFWKTKTLAELTRPEWESLCDGCGKCCLFKMKGEKEKQVLLTKVCCFMLDPQTARCKVYWNRKNLVSSCMDLDAERVSQYFWLPRSCAYRLVFEGKDLPYWHHLVCGDRELIHRLGYSVKDKVISSEFVHQTQLSEYLVDWQ